jgi:hypothetical protein
MPHGDKMVTQTIRRAMCGGSRAAKGGQSVGKFGAAELGFEFADAIHHIAFEVPDGGRSRGVGRFEPGERAPKMPKLVNPIRQPQGF